VGSNTVGPEGGQMLVEETLERIERLFAKTNEAREPNTAKA
jgi:hypothetical protein